MDNEYLERLVETEQRSKSNTKRLDYLEPKVSDIHELTASVKVLATEMKAMREDQVKMDNRLKTLEDKPIKKADKVWEYIVLAVIGAALGAIFTMIGLK